MNSFFVSALIISQEERDEIRLHHKMSRDEKSTSGKRGTSNQSSNYIEPIAPRPFPFEEKACPGPISGNAQNKSKSRAHEDSHAKIIMDLSCLADKDNRATIARTSLKGRRLSDNNDEGKRQKRLLLRGSQNHFVLWNNSGE